MTSNIGSQFIQEFYGSGIISEKERAEMEKRVRAELKKHFRPEFLNRVDAIVIFRSLSEEEITHIVDIQLKRLDQRLAEQNLRLEVDGAAKKLLAHEGYDPQFGARPLKRAIQELVLNPLSMKMLSSEFKPGDTIKVTAKGGQLVFQKK
ncbi:MAG: clpB [Pedosphaera sp.]|nr:clpB [Pedosphaera sp.]